MFSAHGSIGLRTMGFFVLTVYPTCCVAACAAQRPASGGPAGAGAACSLWGRVCGWGGPRRAQRAGPSRRIKGVGRRAPAGRGREAARPVGRRPRAAARTAAPPGFLREREARPIRGFEQL